MTRSRRASLLLAATLTLTGCASGFLGPRIIASNARSVSVEIMPLSTERNARDIADGHCRQFKRYAVLSQDRGDGKFDYQCVL
jgi:hypothetical protein